MVRNKRQFNKGFTLVEMLIVVAIVAVMATVLLFNYSSFSTNVGVRNLAGQIGLTIRKAQSYATSVRSIGGTNSTLSDTYPAYGISFSTESASKSFDPSTTDFVLFADVAPNGDKKTNNLYGNTGVCGSPSADGKQECIENLVLAGGNVVQSLCTDAIASHCFTATNPGTINVVFHRPNPDGVICVVNAQGTGCISQASSYLKVTVQSPKGLKRVITVWNTGQISLD